MGGGWVLGGDVICTLAGTMAGGTMAHMEMVFGNLATSEAEPVEHAVIVTSASETHAAEDASVIVVGHVLPSLYVVECRAEIRTRTTP